MCNLHILEFSFFLVKLKCIIAKQSDADVFSQIFFLNSHEIEVEFLSKVDQKCEVDVISKPPDMHASSKVELFQ